MEDPLEKWQDVKTLTAKKNGFTFLVFKKRIGLEMENGSAMTA